jgi:DNA-binding transcriptional LysR family regulator
MELRQIQYFLPAARAVLVSVDQARAAATGLSGHALRLGTSTGLGERLETVVAELAAKGVQVELVSTSTRARLDRVRSGQLDAAFVRGQVWIQETPPESWAVGGTLTADK